MTLKRRTPRLWLWACLAVLSVLTAAAAVRAEPVVRTINRDWTFNYVAAGKLDEAVARPDFDDRAWPAIAVPHTWSTFETTGDLHPFIKNASERDDPYWWRGWGWYRKHVSIDRRHLGSKVFLELDGVQKYSRVYLNGRFLTEHKGGYTSFSVDLTDAVRFDGDNVLAIAVSNRRDDNFGGIPPMTAGNFNVYGGVYRDVRLVVKDRLHIPFQGSADHEGGTFVTTPEVSAARAVANVRTWVRNDHPDARTAELVTTVRDPGGVVVATLRDRRSIAPGAVAEFNQTTAPLLRPRLWSTETPNVYRVTSEVRAAGRTIDRLESPLGFRWFRWDETAKRLIVNDRPMTINGTNRHQEYPWLGDAMPKRLHDAELRQIRGELGHNFLRAAHYPNDKRVYDLTDQLGIAVVEEVPNIKPIDFGEEIQARNLTEMIRRDRNHPSILFWSVGNETNDAADSCLAKRLDPTRLIHERKSEGYGDCVDHNHEDLDLENLLRVTIRGWHDGEIADRNPVNGQSAGTEEWQHARARVTDGSVRGRIDQQPVAWLYADHGADREYENAPLKHVNAKGWVDLYRVPKHLHHLWRANWGAEPMVYVHPHLWREKHLGRQMGFQVDSNCAEVELSVNGRVVGRQRPAVATFRTVRFDNVLVERGTLAARCVDRPAVTHAVVMAGAPARLVLSTDQSRIAADRADVAIVTADIVDAAGAPVGGATNPLTWEVLGPGRLVGAPRYETDIAKNLQMEGSGYIDAPVKNIVRSTATPGLVRVRVSSPGLAPAEITVESASPPASPADGIVEPRLTDARRHPVARDPNFNPVAEALSDSPTLARIENENNSFPPLSAEALRARLDAFVRARNTTVDTTTPAYAAFLTRLAEAVVRTDRQLIPDDYNFAAANYDDAVRASRYLEAIGLHPEYRRVMARHYADLVVTRGRPLDFEAERARLEPLRTGARLVRSVEPVTAEGPAVSYETSSDTFRVKAGALEPLVTALHPDFADLGPAVKARAIAYLISVNPSALTAGASVPPRNTPVLVPSLQALRVAP